MLKALTSWWWWVSAVLLSIVLNVLSSYAKNPIDHVIERFSARIRERSEQQRRDREKAIALLSERPDLLILAVEQEMRRRLRAIEGLVLCAILILIYQTIWQVAPLVSLGVVSVLAGFALGGTLFTLYVATNTFLSATRVSRLINDVRKKTLAHEGVDLG